MLNFDEIIEKIARHNEDAATFLREVLDVTPVWDHLIDRDVDVSDQEIDTAFMNSLVFLPRNSFYANNFNLLNPIIINAINNWKIANALEQDVGMPDNDAAIAFIIRSSYVDLITMTAMIVKGSEFAVDIGLEARRFVHREGLDGYLEHLEEEKSRRRYNVRK